MGAMAGIFCKAQFYALAGNVAWQGKGVLLEWRLRLCRLARLRKTNSDGMKDKREG